MRADFLVSVRATPIEVITVSLWTDTTATTSRVRRGRVLLWGAQFETEALSLVETKSSTGSDRSTEALMQRIRQEHWCRRSDRSTDDPVPPCPPPLSTALDTKKHQINWMKLSSLDLVNYIIKIKLYSLNSALSGLLINWVVNVCMYDWSTW